MHSLRSVVFTALCGAGLLFRPTAAAVGQQPVSSAPERRHSGSPAVAATSTADRSVDSLFRTALRAESAAGAASIYRMISVGFPAHARAGEALHHLAELALANGDRDRAVLLLSRAQHEYPMAATASDTHVLLARLELEMVGGDRGLVVASDAGLLSNPSPSVSRASEPRAAAVTSPTVLLPGRLPSPYPTDAAPLTARSTPAAPPLPLRASGQTSVTPALGDTYRVVGTPPMTTAPATPAHSPPSVSTVSAAAEGVASVSRTVRDSDAARGNAASPRLPPSPAMALLLRSQDAAADTVRTASPSALASTASAAPRARASTAASHVSTLHDAGEAPHALGAVRIAEAPRVTAPAAGSTPLTIRTALPAIDAPASASSFPTGAAGRGVSAGAARTYTVQLAAYGNRADADALVARLRRSGLDARATGTSNPYRVRAGHYRTWQLAQAAGATLHARGWQVFVTESESRAP